MDDIPLRCSATTWCMDELFYLMEVNGRNVYIIILLWNVSIVAKDIFGIQ